MLSKMAILLGDATFTDDVVDAGVFERESDPSTDAKEDTMVKHSFNKLQQRR